MIDNFGNGQGIEILCNGFGESLQCTGVVGKTPQNTMSGASYGNTLNFSIISEEISGENVGDGTFDVEYSAGSYAHNEGNILHYTITERSSQKLPLLEVTPLIFTSEPGGPNLTFKGTSVVCSDSDNCSISGTYMMNKSGTYYVHGYIDFTSPLSMTNLGCPEHFYLMPDSDFIYYTTNLAGPFLVIR